MLTRRFGPEERAFLLRVPQWQEVEKRCDCGLIEIMARLAPIMALIERGLKDPGAVVRAAAQGQFGSAHLKHIREPIAQGLIGGGLSTTDAYALTDAVFELAIQEKRLVFLEFGALALEIVSAALFGPVDEAADEARRREGEPKGAAGKGRRRSPTARPGSERSTPAQA
jgi:hypothetical protein